MCHKCLPEDKCQHWDTQSKNFRRRATNLTASQSTTSAVNTAPVPVPLLGVTMEHVWRRRFLKTVGALGGLRSACWMVSRKALGALLEHEKECPAALVKRHTENVYDVYVLQVRHKQGGRPTAFICTAVLVQAVGNVTHRHVPNRVQAASNMVKLVDGETIGTQIVRPKLSKSWANNKCFIKVPQYGTLE